MLNSNMLLKNVLFRNRLNKLSNRLGSQLYHGMTGGEIVYNKLLQYNVNDVWISTGGAVMPLVDAFYNGKINYYLPSHEQSGGHCAAGYAKVTGKPGISIVTSGPGFTNSLTALTDAMNDSVPFILFSGQVPKSVMGTLAFQECPSVEMSRPVAKWSHCVEDINELPSVIDKAFDVALSGKPGAVHIDLPKCITSQKMKNEIFPKFVKKEKDNNSSNSQKDFDDIINIINNSKKAVIIAGQGCNNSYHLLRKFSKITNIPVTTTIHSMGAFDETDKLSLEFLGMHGNPSANYAVMDSDLIIGIGTRFDDRITGNISKFASKAYTAYKEKKGGIIHVNINEKEINHVLSSHYNFNMDSKIFFERTIPYLKKTKNDKWIDTINNWKKKYPFKYTRTDKIKTQEVIIELNNYLLDKRINNYYISTGVGNHQMMASQFIKWKYPKSFLTSGSLGTMGVGLPYAVGAQIAKPNSLIIDIDGDGSFNHSLQELKSIRDYNLPIKIFIMNDNKLSMVKAWEKLFYEERYTATDLKVNPNYTQLAESFGIKGIKCNDKKELKNVIDYAINFNGPILCDFQVEGDLCLPLVAPGKAIDEMILNSGDISIDSKMMPPG